jgi:hypothetical protein
MLSTRLLLVVSHLWGVITIAITARHNFTRFPVVFVFGALYLIQDSIEHGTGLDAVSEIGAYGLMVCLLSEFLYRLHAEQGQDPTANLLLVSLFITAYAAFLIAAKEDGRQSVCGTPRCVCCLEHVLVWLVFYGIVTGKTGIWNAIIGG